MAALLNVAATTPGSPFENQPPASLAFEGGRVFLKAEGAGGGVAFGDVLKRANLRQVSGSGSAPSTFGNTDAKFSTHSFGCHFVEVTWQPEIARLRVSRVVTVIDAGRILNPLAGRNQIEGAVVMGIGMALFEHLSHDPQTGAPLNSSFADYVVALNADVPAIEVHFVEYPDKELNELGARGIGEIGLAGVAAAITAAVHHATGIRVRELPVTIEKLLVQGDDGGGGGLLRRRGPTVSHQLLCTGGHHYPRAIRACDHAFRVKNRDVSPIRERSAASARLSSMCTAPSLRCSRSAQTATGCNSMKRSRNTSR